MKTRTLIVSLLIAGLLVGLTAFPVRASDSESEMACPIDPNGSHTDNTIITTTPPDTLIWTNLTYDYVWFPLSNTKVKVKVQRLNGNPNMYWYTNTENARYLGYQYVNPLPDGLWDVHFAFRYHPNITVPEQMVRLAACGSVEGIWFRQSDTSPTGWQIGNPFFQ